MVMRVALFVSALSLAIGAGFAPTALAAYPEYCPPTGCAPAYNPPIYKVRAAAPPQMLCRPPQYAAPYCGPRVGPLSLCGGILAGCTATVGRCLGIPAAIMGGLLRPPRQGCGGPMFRRPLFPRLYARRRMLAQANYGQWRGAPMQGRRVSKCKVSTYAPPCPPPVRYVCGPPRRARCGPALPVCCSLALRLLSLPFRLVSGGLVGAPIAMPFADKSVTSEKPTFGCYW